jgi:APA family basic amino acid/polyamine antiporter
MTLMKVVGIMIFVAAAFVWGSGTLSGLFAVTPVFDLVRDEGRLPQSLATSLVFVMFCYSGWNASAYIASEMKQPRRDLPRSLVLGTLLVLVLYLGLNVVFFYAVGAAGLAGEVEVGLIAGRALFGDFGASLVAVVICVSILASVSAMTIAGPRVYFAFGRDFPPLRALGRVGRTSAPTLALLLQGVVTSILIVSGRVDQIQQYAGFTLSLFASLAVSCVIVLRIRQPGLRRPFRVWAYPLPPLLFLSVSLWMMLWAYRARPLESTLAVLTAVVGGVIFLLLSRRQWPLPLAETEGDGDQ